MNKIQTSIVIDAPAKIVWQILTNFDSYSKWNPFIIKSEGHLKKGGILNNTIQLEGQKAQTFNPVILQVEEEKSFKWMGSLFVKGLFDGEHYFELEAIDSHQTRLIHGEQFSGILSKVILSLIKEKTIAGFEQMNKALKEKAESIARLAA